MFSHLIFSIVFDFSSFDNIQLEDKYANFIYVEIQIVFNFELYHLFRINILYVIIPFLCLKFILEKKLNNNTQNILGLL
jgi:hypothetical protein